MKGQANVLKYLTRALFAILIYIAISSAFSKFSPLEFIDRDQKLEYDLTLILATPLIVFLLVILDYLKNRKSRLFMLNFILGIPLSIISLFIPGLLYVSFDDCKGNEHLLFTNQFNQDQKIIHRSTSWGCNPDKASTHKVTELNNWFQWTQKVDTTALNPYKWRPLKNRIH